MHRSRPLVSFLVTRGWGSMSLGSNSPEASAERAIFGGPLEGGGICETLSRMNYYTPTSTTTHSGIVNDVFLAIKSSFVQIRCYFSLCWSFLP